MSDDFLRFPDDEEPAHSQTRRAFFPAGAVADIPDGKGRSVWIRNRKVAVFKIDGTLYACRDRCTHMGAALAEGRITGRRVACTWHGWTFDLQSGKCVNKDWASVEAYQVRIIGDRFEVELPLD